MVKWAFIGIMSLHISTILCQQVSKKWALGGYISGMQTAMIPNIEKPWIKEDLLHNRLNFLWFPSNKITINVHIRNRIIWGDREQQIIGYYKSLDGDDGFFDLSKNISSNSYYAINTFIDRANLELIKGNLNLTLGRQRINWGKTTVWNTNDIFNTYSFFDVDYPERPGSDALRLQYYTSYTSVFELVTKLDNKKNLTVGALYRFNVGTYDIQFIGSSYRNKSWALGTGWEGNIKNIGFQGEGTLLIPKNTKDSLSNTLLLSTSLGYVFSNSLNLYGEILLRIDSTKHDKSNFSSFLTKNNDIRSLAFSDISLLGQLSYPFGPLITGSISMMYFPDINIYLINPSCEISIKENLYLSLIYQYFGIKLDRTGKKHMHVAYLKIKWDF